MLEIRSVAVSGRLLSTSFSLGIGDAIVITGPNGSGKSTLLECLSGVLKPSSGVISIANKEQPAYLPQLPPRPFAYTVREYLMVGEKQHRWSKFNPIFDIDPLLDKEVTSLSAGQWQRVAITKVLSQTSALILLDEPDAPLDTHWSECLDSVLSDEISEGRVIVLTLHRQDIQKSWKYQALNLAHTTSS